ncbi:MAG: TonB-dependent receptor [Acidobacteria bacterium]|nr:TonB-dependent receptor [Acidobacteriota bacterium]
MAPLAYGQATATLTGIVMDQSKAVVPGADITLTDELSGDARRTVSNAEGFFTFTALQARTYKLKVEMTGFQAWERPGIVVHPGDRINIADIVLIPGARSETVVVTGESYQTTPVDSGEKSVVVTAQQIQNTAIVGRDATELLKILPGMVAIPADGITNRPGFTGEVIGINGNGAAGKQSAIGNYSGNGSRPDAIDINADGVHVSDPGCNCASPVTPNVDMIQEFKVQGASFSAENSKGPVVVTSVAKAGGSQFHGSGYYYFRRWNLNSAEWLANATPELKDKRPKSNFNFPGFNVSGPVVIPGTDFNKNRDKLFFFYGMEWIRQDLDTGVRKAVVPTDAMKAGDFSDGAYLSSLARWAVQSVPNKNGFVNGKPVVPLDPGGRALINLYPKPNADPKTNQGYNFVELGTVKQPLNIIMTRVDYSISDNTKLYVRYNWQRETQPFKYGLWWDSSEVPLPSNISAPNRSDSVSVNLAHVFSPTLTNEFTFGYTFIDFPNTWDDPQKVSKKAIGYPYKGLFKNTFKSLDQIPGYTDWSSGIASLLEVGGFDPVLYATKHLLSFGDNVTKVAGTHTLKAGFYYEHIINKQPNSDMDNGRIIPATWAANDTGNSYSNLILGVTSEYYESTRNLVNDEAYHVVEGFVQDSWKIRPNFTLEAGLRLSHLGPWYGRHEAAAAIFDPKRYSNNPADLTRYTGIVDNFIDSSVPRSGTDSAWAYWGPRFGFAWSVRKDTVVRGGFGTFNFHDAQQASALTNPPRTLKSTVYNYNISQIDALTPALAKVDVFVLNRNDDRMPRTYSWNFTISQRLPWQTLLEGSYVGNASNYLLNNGKDFNIPADGCCYRPVGEDVDWNSVRPYQNYGSMALSEHTMNSNYHSMQVLLSRQTGRLTYSAAYTFGKALGYRNGGWATGTGSNSYDLRRRDYGVLGYDRTQAFNIAYSYILPEFFKGSAVGKALINGWQFSGITSFQSGVNLGAQTGNFGIEVRQTQPNGDIVTLNNANIVGSNWTTVQPLVTCDPRANLKEGQYINGGCFGAPSPRKNGAYQFPYIRGPMYMNWDLSVFKSFQIGQDENRKFQVRFSGYNFTNHPLWTFYSGDPALNLRFLDGKQVNDQFGYPSRKVGKRLVQFAFKFMF